MEDTLKNKLEQSIKDRCEKHDRKFNEDVFNKMIEGLPVDIEELYEDVLYHECEHDEYSIDTDEDYGGRPYRYATCNYCGAHGDIIDDEDDYDIEWF